jgi:hypothetical protein
MKSMNAFFLLPSVKDKRILEIKNISIEEAKDFLHIQTIKLINSPDIEVKDYLTGLKAEIEFLHPISLKPFIDEIDTNNIAYQPLYEQIISKIFNLVNICVKDQKYRRAIYTDLDQNIIAFSTILFGSKFGYINYYDSNLNNELAGIQSYIDNYNYQDIL